MKKFVTLSIAASAFILTGLAGPTSYISASVEAAPQKAKKAGKAGKRRNRGNKNKVQKAQVKKVKVVKSVTRQPAPARKVLSPFVHSPVKRSLRMPSDHHARIAAERHRQKVHKRRKRARRVAKVLNVLGVVAGAYVKSQQHGRRHVAPVPNRYAHSPRDYGHRHNNFGRHYCLAPRQIRRGLRHRGWRRIQLAGKNPRVIKFIAMRPNGRMFKLKLDRCTGELLKRRLVGHAGIYDRYAY